MRRVRGELIIVLHRLIASHTALTLDGGRGELQLAVTTPRGLEIGVHGLRRKILCEIAEDVIIVG